MLLCTVPMERHKCKLCSRTFANGRALGGHMKAHLATLPLPPKTQQLTESASYSSSSSGEEPEPEQEQQLQEEEEEEEKGLVYGLRENPKRSFRLADPEFSFAVDAGFVIQDRESETESKNPTRRRSKRNRRSFVVVTEIQRQQQSQKLELQKKTKLTNSTQPSLAESMAEPEPVSSVSDTSPEEDVAMCLMMLSRDVWMRRANDQQQADQSDQHQEHGKQAVEKLEGMILKKVRGKNRCEKCSKLFRSYQAMCGHKKICFRNEDEAINNAGGEKLFECPFCCKIFGSGQALGGHKRSHLSGASKSMAAGKTEVRETFIDLNLPAPQEEDDFSVLSDA